MKAFEFTIVVEIAGKNLESAKNKLSGWLEPSLALKKNDSITLNSVDLSDNVDSTEKTPSKKKKALPKPSKAKPKEEEEDEWDPEWEDADWDSLDEDEDEEEDGTKRTKTKMTSIGTNSMTKSLKNPNRPTMTMTQKSPKKTSGVLAL